VHRVADCIIRRVILQPSEWQHIGNQIDAAMIFARANFVNVLRFGHREKKSIATYAKIPNAVTIHQASQASRGNSVNLR